MVNVGSKFRDSSWFPLNKGCLLRNLGNFSLEKLQAESLCMCILKCSVYWLGKDLLDWSITMWTTCTVYHRSLQCYCRHVAAMLDDH